VLEQIYKNIELIIIDNYSDDDTEKIVKSFSDERVMYLKFHNNGVIAASRNIGINNAKGDYIAFIDSDDTWHHNKIDTQMDCFRMYPDLMLVACDFEINDGTSIKKRSLLHRIKKERMGKLYNTIMFKNLISCSTVLVRTDVFKKVGIFDEDPNMVSVEDWDLWLRIAYSYPICIMPKILGGYGIHSNNTSKTSNMLRKMVYVIDKNVDKGWIPLAKAWLLKCLIFIRKIRSLSL